MTIPPLDLGRTFDHHPGRNGRRDIDYARLAREYVDLVKQGEHPLRGLVAEYGSTATRWSNRVSEARKRGVITGSRGTARLTDYARNLLGAQQ
ncbi:hypothetical protein [Actinoplanes sp. NPDC026670]|uniref:hypothetical protein n=1 Tax=Actinoplanes sp. NPDC026670 TaxID=3154700 RepID=UPI0033F2E98F